MVHRWEETTYLGYDPEDPNTRNIFLAVGTLAWVVLYFVADLLSGLISKTHQQMKAKDKMFWNLCIVRGAFGITFTLMGAYCAFLGNEFGPNKVLDSSPLSKFTIMIAVSFFIFECLALAIFDVAFQTFDMALFVHHVISLNGFSTVMFTGTFHYFACAGAALESSTPFTGYSWIMWKCGFEKTWHWRKNQWMMVHAFHGRSFIECFLWLQSYMHWTDITTYTPWIMLLAFYPGLILMTAFLTPTWLSKKTHQLASSTKKAQIVKETQMAFGLVPNLVLDEKEILEAKKKKLRTI